MSSDEIAVFPKVNTLTVHSGNTVNWNKLKRKAQQTSTEEIVEVISSSLNKFLKAADRNELQYVTELNCTNDDLRTTLSCDERNDLKVTVKMILCDPMQPPGVINDIVGKALYELNTPFVETVLLAFHLSDSEITLEQIQPYWEVMEELVQQKTVLSLGVCDLDLKLLEQLCEWAKVKPCVDQVNLASCCVMPQDLQEFAKQRDIQLLTHNDAPVLLPTPLLQSAIRSCSTERDAEGWEPLWVLRYSAIVKCRGIINSKGYIIQAARRLRRRPDEA